MKKRLLTVLLAVCLVLALGTVTAMADNESNAISISSVEDLQKIGNDEVYPVSGNYVLTTSLDLSSVTSWDPIGTASAPFTGTFDGQGYTISNLTINNSDLDYAGLFGRIASPGVVKNIVLENVTITGRAQVGALAGSAYTGTVQNCTVQGLINITGNYKVGGLAGEGYATMENCHVIGNAGSSVTGNFLETDLEGDNVAGLVGYRGEGNIVTTNCTVSGLTVTGSRKVGGLIGTFYMNNTLSGCAVSDVTVSTNATADYAESNATTLCVGGLLGILTRNGNNGGEVMDCIVEDVALVNTNNVTQARLGYVSGGVRDDSWTTNSEKFPVPTTDELTISNVYALGTNTGSNVPATQDDTTGALGGTGTSLTEDAVARVNGKIYSSLSQAISEANDGDTITLVKGSKGNTSVELSDGRSITLDMNGFDAGFAQNANIKIYHGNLNITGSGMLYEEKPYYAPVMMYGSGESVADYSVVTVGPNVTLRGWAGLFIDCHDAHASQAYGIVANVYGTLESVKDTTGAGGHALYINGTIKATDGNVPHFILDGSTLITEDGNGMYLAGYAETEIKDSTITSSSEGSTGIEIRAGKLKISGDTVITGGSGEFTATPNGNGSTTGNVALAVVQHTTKLPLAVGIEDGIFIGGAAMFEQNAQKNDAEAIAKINIEVRGGEYRGQIYSENIDSFIRSGNFSEPVSEEYLSPTLTAELYSRSNPAAPYSYYPSVKDALEAAQPGDVVTDLSGVTTNIRHEVKFDNNGTVDTINVLDGATITFTAPTRSGYEFRGWRDGSGELHKAGDVVTVNSDMTFTAVWSAINIPDTYDIEIADTANGSVDTSLSNASAGSTITITATPDSGYSVASVTVTGPDGRVDVVRVNATTYTFKMPAGDVTVRVTFTDSDALPFTDVSAGQWFYDAVAYVYTNGMMEGDSATTFNPDGTMTRAMFWAVLGRIDGATITGTNWADQARDWAMAEGVSDGTDPNGLVTREQMVTMLWRYAGEPESTASLSAYTDADSVSDWAETAMRWAIDEGIITGMTDTTLVPQGTATRAQCAAIFMRFDQM